MKSYLNHYFQSCLIPLALSYRFLNSLICQPVNCQNGVLAFYTNKSYDTWNQIELEGDIHFENN